LGIGLALLGAPAPALAISAGLAPVLGLAAIRGVGFGLVTVAGSALVAELVPAGELGRASARYGLAIGLPQLGLLPVGVGVVEWFGFVPVLVAGASPLLGLPLLPLIGVARAPTGEAGATEESAPPAGAGAVVREAPEEPRPATSTGDRERGRAAEDSGEPRDAPSAAAVPDRRRRRMFWIAGSFGPLLAMLACATAQGGLITFLPLVQSDAGVALPAALFATAAGSLVGRLLAGELTDRGGWGGRMLRPGASIALLGAVAEVGVVGVTGSALLALVPVGALLVGLGFGLVQNDSMVSLFALAGPHGYGGASALWNMAYDAGTGVGAVGLGAVAQAFGYRSAFGAAAAALLLTVLSPLRPSRGR
jgi:MFS family permease